jgi:hypothetical protein
MITSTHIEIKLPQLVMVDDYHEFNVYADVISKLHKSKVKVREVCFADTGKYVGVVFVGRKPTTADLNQMLADNGVKKQVD